MDQDVCLCSRCKPQPQEFFDAKMRAIADDDTDAAANGTERYLVSPIAYLNNAYLKWLIYSAAFNEPFAESRGAMRVQFIPRLDEDLSVLARQTFSAGGCSRRWRFGMPGSLYAGRVAVVCCRA